MKLILLIAVSLLITSCAQEECRAPANLIGDICCFDEDNDNICDSQQAKETAPEPAVESIPAPSMPTADEFSSSSLHWDHMPITYSVGNECGSYETRQITRAFDEIQNSTNNAVSFKKVSGSADINVSCEYVEDCYEEKTRIEHEGDIVRTYRTESFCAYNRGLARYWLLGNKITSAHITMYGLAGFAETAGKGASGFFIGTCGDYQTEMHEILHALGFGHVDDPKSIMYFQAETVGHHIYTEGTCAAHKKSIDKDIIQTLVGTYRKV